MTAKEAESLIGRLNNVGYILDITRNFLGRIRAWFQRLKWGSTRLSTEEIKDLELWIKFLRLANRGVSLNSLVFRKYEVVGISDACEYGMGGYTTNGQAWRFLLPPNLQGVFTVNFLEFCAVIITLWLELLENKTNVCYLVLSDSSSALG